jgi:nitroreductase
MDAIEAIKTRRSIRAFKPAPVPKELLKEILEVAIWAPSAGNIQPWEIVVMGGEPFEKLKQRLAAKRAAGDKPYSDVPWPHFPEYLQARRHAHGKRLFEFLGIDRHDTQKRLDWTVRMSRFMDAPNGIFVCCEASLGEWVLLDIGYFLYCILLSAHAHGLGTCGLGEVIRYPDVIREMMGIPESKRLIAGIAIGYPDWDHPYNKFMPLRQPLDSCSVWRGFDDK